MATTMSASTVKGFSPVVKASRPLTSSVALRGSKVTANVKASARRSALKLSVQATAAPAGEASANCKMTTSPSSVAAIILGGGAGTRLYPLTATRAKPAVNIGGAYRLIDVPMSNCINSSINKIYILTQFNSTSLNRHLSRAYNVAGNAFGGDAFVEVLAAAQTPSDKEWFQGTADAVRQYSWLIGDMKNRDVEDIVILSGDHLYRMDYMAFVDYHRANNADITVGALPCGYDRASSFGLMKTDDSGRIVEFAEKPPPGEELESMKVDTTKLGLSEAEAAENPFMASMGIYVFKKQALLDLLEQNPEKHDFGGEIIPDCKDERKVMAYLFNGYWEDIGTIKSFFDANLNLTQQPPNFEFYDPVAPIYTSSRFLPPAKVENCKLTDAIVGHGATVCDSTINHAIVGLRSKVGKGCSIKDVILMGNDSYESDDQAAALIADGKVPLGVGEGSTLSNCIIDKNVRIGKNVSITNAEGIEDKTIEEDGIYIRSGIVVVHAGTTLPDGFTI